MFPSKSFASKVNVPTKVIVVTAASIFPRRSLLALISKISIPLVLAKVVVPLSKMTLSLVLFPPIISIAFAFAINSSVSFATKLLASTFWEALLTLRTLAPVFVADCKRFVAVETPDKSILWSESLI